MKVNQGIPFNGSLIITGSIADHKSLQQKIGEKVKLAVSAELEPKCNNVRLYATGKDIDLVTKVESSRVFLKESQQLALQVCSEYAMWGGGCRNIPSVEEVLQKEVKPLLQNVKKVDAKKVLKAIRTNSFDFEKLEFKNIFSFIEWIIKRLPK